MHRRVEPDQPSLLPSTRPALRELDEAPATRAIVLAGAGERAFSAGQDLSETASFDASRDRVMLGNRGPLAYRGSPRRPGGSPAAEINALDGLTRQALGEALAAAQADARVGALVLRSA